ncbi:hypothetical protein IFM89_032586 [Coptis chinensis]|uniref:Transmembrane protein 131-like N-terminal domain-containing protein n=1 Tax=Coptis chinensis TaxID=261450 RepID=A0A835IRS3_9MAGN|nr:hypothetical protein IFM89_032586 [Coptis chinensis]
MSRQLKGLLLVTLLCLLCGLARSGPCATTNVLVQGIDEMTDMLNFDDACGSFGDKSNSAGEMSSNYVQGSLPTISGVKEVCTNSELFCFPSTLRALLAKEEDCNESPHDVTRRQSTESWDSWQSNSTWLSNHGTFRLMNGNVVSFANTCNETSLRIFKPFSTDPQFYPCNFDEVLLGPGEVTTICFVFLPRQLGLLSAHLVLQSSSGGFLIHAKGMAIKSLFQTQPLVGLNVSFGGGLKRNLSVYNPFDDTLYVKEVATWLSVSSEHISHSAEAVCKVEQSLGEYSSFLNVEEWLDIRSGQDDFPLMELRPHRSWEISPHSTETIMEMNFLSGFEGKLFGAFSMKLQSSSRTDTIVLPLEAEVRHKPAYSDLTGSVIVYLESVPCDGCETSIILSLENRAANLLHFAKISEVTENEKIFRVKYIDRLLLFPGNVTQAAIIYCPSSDLREASDGVLEIDLSCKLLVLTNDSGNSQIEIPCQDVVQACLKYRHVSYVGQEFQRVQSQAGSEMTESLGNSIHFPSGSSEMKSETLKTVDADEVVLRNWRSQRTTSGKSVLDHEEVMFPVVQVGSHSSKWITVKNPSQQPVLMQLVLNSGTVVNQCKSVDNFIQQQLASSFVQNESAGPTSYGFGIADNAVTEAYVHPFGKAQLGPIIFHPSNRCGWSGSALIRNNLSGVEWLSLKGFGGSLSLVLLEGSEPIRSIVFNLDMPVPINRSPQEVSFQLENSSVACSKSMSKEFYAMNTGDLPLEVRKIEVSGATCGLDGFMVHTCKGFALEPGESRKLQISYETDFSAAVVHRDLELALVTGILVIPMKASFPVHMLNVCRKSFLWISLKKVSLVVVFAASITFVVFSYILPYMMALGSQDCLLKTENATICRARKPSLQDDQKNKKSRRRRKRRSSGAGLTGLLEVSSSQSGNSTPSSPMSPLMSSTPKATWPLAPGVENGIETENPFVKVKEHVYKAGTGSTSSEVKVAGNCDKGGRQYISSQPVVSVPRKVACKAMLLPSATFPCMHQRVPGMVIPTPFSCSSSAINPDARAPGSNLKEKTPSAEEKKNAEDKFKYDIWGKHLSGLHLMSTVNEASTLIPNASEEDSQSFFVRGPQVLMQKTKAKSVSPAPSFSQPAVTSLLQNG